MVTYNEKDGTITIVSGEARCWGCGREIRPGDTVQVLPFRPYYSDRYSSDRHPGIYINSPGTPEEKPAIRCAERHRNPPPWIDVKVVLAEDQ